MRTQKELAEVVSGVARAGATLQKRVLGHLAKLQFFEGSDNRYYNGFSDLKQTRKRKFKDISGSNERFPGEKWCAAKRQRKNNKDKNLRIYPDSPSPTNPPQLSSTACKSA